MKKYNVFGIGNALVDCVYMVEDKFLIDNNIEKGLMTLVDEEKQKSIIEKIKNFDSVIQSGGSVTNSVYTLSHLGGSGYVSVLVAEDEFGKIYLNDLIEVRSKIRKLISEGKSLEEVQEINPALMHFPVGPELLNDRVFTSLKKK